MADNLGPDFRDAVKGAEQLEVEYPSAWRWFVGHPGVLANRTKSPQEYERNQRLAYIINRLKEQGYRASHVESQMPSSGLGAYMASPKLLEALESPYERVGIMADGQPLAVAAKWAGMGVSGVNNLGAKNLANQADWAVSKMAGGQYVPPYPDAIQDGVRDLNTFSFFLPEHLYGRALPAHDTTNPSSIELSDNYEVLKNAGVPDYAAVPIASIHDGAVDPFGAFGFLRARKLPFRKGVEALGWDFGPEFGTRTIDSVLSGLRED